MSIRPWVLLLGAAVGACSDPMSPSAPPPPLTVTVAYCTGLQPIWVAFQDGDGAWTQAQPAASGGTTTFRSEFSADRGAIAMVTRSGAISILSVLYGAPAELVTAGDTNPRHCGPAPAKTLLGTASGVDANDVAFVGASFGSRARVGVDSTFELKGLASGPRDLLATRVTQTTGAITRVILRRDIDVPDSTVLPVFDFGSAEAFAPAVASVSVEGLGAEGATSGTRFLSSHDELEIALLTNLTTDATRPYFALPETRLRAGELQVVTAATTAATTGSARLASFYFRAPTDRTLTLGAPIIQPTFTTVATAPAVRLLARFVPQNAYDRAAIISYQQDSTVFVVITMTAAYSVLSGNGYDLVIPDLSGAAGFDPAWALRPGGTLLWSAVRIGGTLGLGADAVPTDGTIQRTATSTGTIPAQ